MKSKLLRIVAVFALVAVVISGSVFAETTTQIIDNDYFYADQDVKVENLIIDGNAFIAGKDVELKNLTVNGSIAVAGQDVDIAEVTVTGDIFVAGQNVKVVTSSAKNIYAAGQKVNVDEETTVTRDAYLAGTNVAFNALADAVSVGANKVVIGENAVIREIRGETDNEANIASGAKIVENLIRIVEENEEVAETAKKAVVTATIMQAIKKILTGIVMVLIVAFIISKSSKKERIQKYTGEKIALNALAGFGIMVGFILASIILLFTVILLPIGVIGILLYIVMLLCATAVGVVVITIKVLKDKELSTKNIILWSLLVVVILFIVKMIPFIGGIIGFAVSIIGIGTMFDLLFGKDKKEDKVEVVETKTEPVVEEKTEE